MEFSNDEKIFLNKCALDSTKDELMQRIKFNLVITEEDKEGIITEMLLELESKIKEMEDNEWDDLQSKLPFITPYTDYDTEEFAEYENAKKN